METKIKLEIEILGSGCMSCQKMFEITKEAIQNTGLSEIARVTKVEDFQRMMELGVMSTPGLVINDRIISTGKVYKLPDLEKLLIAEAAK